ncbi:MAG TPA: tetratricopeptide repeat protein [Longimicrobium sp.]|jgi:tetratricopeptide (TPR) repeat protein|uniref:tetratricopeptide repeat protein n=1 Tax=Longimicrobium sp. TaxID=2029185 RepID=UPI002ED79D0C
MRHQIIAAAIAAFVCANTAAAQAPVPTAADSALAECSAAARAKNEAAALSAADRAESLYRAQLAAPGRGAYARVGIARVIGECRIGFADFMSQGRLSGQSVDLLKEALAIDSTHWSARFVLAMNYFYAPAFLGRADDAAREFQHLIDQQGGRTNPPVYAQPWIRLGELHARQRRYAQALAVWRRGAELFPAEARFAELIRENERRAQAPDSAAPAPALAAAPAAAPAPPSAASTAPPRAGQRTVALEAITVHASSSRMDDTRSGTALKRLDVLMTPGGTADLMQAIQTGPGTTRAAEGSDLYVRGGDPAESPVWVDGARLVYAGRYENLNGAAFGVLDPAVLGSASFSSGGFSARFGNALSGVLDVETLGRPTTRAGVLSANTVGAGAMMQTPLSRTVGAWGALRATEGSLMLAMHGRGDEFSVSPRGLEGIGGMVWTPRPGWQVKATGMVDEDESARGITAYGYTGAFRSRGGTRLATLSARGVSRDGRTAMRATLAGTERTSRFGFGVMDRARTDQTVSARVDADRMVGGGRLRVGAEAAGMDARRTGTTPTTDQLAPGSPSVVETAERDDASHLGGYAEYEWAPGGRVGVVAGVRADRLPGEDAWTVDPRLALALRTGAWTLRVGGGEFHQGRWRTRFALPNAGSPSGTPTRARHLVAGVERAGEPSMKVEVYGKEYDGYAAAGAGPQIRAGRAAGMDAVVRWSRQDRLNGWVTYSALRGRVDLADGSTAPSAVDVTHSFTGVATLRLPYDLQLGNTLRYATGRPYTERDSTGYGAPNGGRLPEYLRLDTRVTRFWTVGGRLLVTYAEMLNTTNRHNVSAYSYDEASARRTTQRNYFATRTLVLGGSLNF